MMELKLLGLTEMAVDGNVEVTLPSFMTMLPQASLDQLCNRQQRDRVIIAAGRKSDSTKVVMLTANGVFLSLDIVLPKGDVFPVDHGQKLMVGPKTFSARWAIENSIIDDRGRM